MKKSGQVFEIIQADIQEVSLVNRGANRRSFFLIKSLTGGKLMKAFAKAYLELFGSEPTEAFLKAVESLDENIRKERTAALVTIAEFKDDMDEEVVKALETLITNLLIVKEVVEKEKPVLSPEVKKAIDDLNTAAGVVPVAVEKKGGNTEGKGVEGYVEVELDDLEKSADKSAQEMIDNAKKTLKS